MNHMNKKSLIILVTFCLSSIYAAKLGDIQNSLIFLSPGVSGTHLTMQNIYMATKGPVYLMKPTRYTRKYNPLRLPIDKNAQPYFHTHNPSHLRLIDKKSNKLLLVIRNYKNWMIRQHIAELVKRNLPVPNPISAEWCLQTLQIRKTALQYFLFLRAYDQWPQNTRLMLHYEDLVESPKECLQKIQSFLGKESSDIEADLEMLAELKAKSKEFYNTRLAHYGGSLSSGTSNYTDAVSKEDLRGIDEKIRRINPKLFDTYVARYREP